jgi:hypothetical protein
MGDRSAGNLRRLVPVALMTIALGFVGYTAWTLYESWEPDRVRISVPFVLLAMVPMIVGLVLQAWGWVRLVRRMSGAVVRLPPGLKLYFDSQLARYAPGKIGLPLVRIEGGTRMGMSAALVGSSVLIETLCWAAVGSVTSLLALAGSGHQKAAIFALLGRYAVPLLVLFSAGLLLLMLLDRRRFPDFVARWLRLDGNGPLVPFDLPAIHVGVWAAWGIHGYLVSRAIGAAPEDSTPAISASMIAQIAGFLIVAAPAGLGVREAVFSLALVPSVGSVGAVSAAVLSRACTLVAEVLCWAATRATAKDGTR